MGKGEVMAGTDENRLKGMRIKGLPHPNRAYSKGRVCAAPGCGTLLSVYNRWQYCWQHEPIHSYSPRGRRKKRERREAA